MRSLKYDKKYNSVACGSQQLQYSDIRRLQIATDACDVQLLFIIIIIIIVACPLPRVVLQGSSGGQLTT